MTEVLRSPSHFASSPRRISSSSSSSSTPSSSLSCVPQPSLTCPTPPNDFPLLISMSPHSPSPSSSSASLAENGDFPETNCEAAEVKYRDKLSLLALLFTLFRKSLIACKSDRRELCAMEIGWPTNVRHVAHVTFDRFNGFLGLPVEFEPEVPSRAPSASTTVFGVSTDSMQLSYDPRGNSVPTILLLMQRHLYARGGLQAEGIFRINGENSQEEYVRDQLNRGIVPEAVEVHCLAGLVKAWFRELPTGILDSLSAEQVMQCQTEEECAELVRLLPFTEAALLDWAVNLMADVVQEERLNKMNTRNIAMVFAPNMTQMADPITALMYAVQVMNFLKSLIIRTLREREDSVDGPDVILLEPFDENDPQGPSLACLANTIHDEEEVEAEFTCYEPALESHSDETLCESNGSGISFGRDPLRIECLSREWEAQRRQFESEKSSFGGEGEGHWQYEFRRFVDGADRSMAVICGFGFFLFISRFIVVWLL